MNTPTPEQLQEFNAWMESYDTSGKRDFYYDTELYELCTAYANHVNAELLRKLASLQEQKNAAIKIINQDIDTIANLQQQLTASQERCKELESKIQQGQKTYNNPTNP